jgi:hypothetical protein
MAKWRFARKILQKTQSSLTQCCRLYLRGGDKNTRIQHSELQSLAKMLTPSQMAQYHTVKAPRYLFTLAMSKVFSQERAKTTMVT